MTIKEGERLAVVESEVAHLREDVREVKSDVKSLLAASLINAAANTATSQARASTGTWVRSFLPPIISGVLAYVAAKVF